MPDSGDWRFEMTLYGNVSKDGKAIGFARDGHIYESSNGRTVLYDLEGDKMLCPTTGQVLGYLDDSERVHLRALAENE
jgi:hypothetical protein